jgi:hypothetical protein
MSRILAMKDSLANYKVSKEHLFNLPMKLLIIGKSELSGKSTLVGNLLMRPFDDTDKDGMEFYKGDFKGENIYIVNPSLFLDDKWVNIIRAKRVPEGNIYLEFDEDLLTELYKKLEQQYAEEVELGKVNQKLIIFDDCAYSGDLKSKNHGILSKMIANGRHIALSTIITSQKYSSINTLVRENATGIILFECSAKQLELVAEDHAIQSKKQFEQMFRTCTREKHTFMVINYSNPIEARFMDSKFEPIK